MAAEKPTIHIVGSILKAVLVPYPGMAGQAHAGKAVIPGNDQIARLLPVDLRKIHTVGALFKNQGNGAAPLQPVGSVAKQKAPRCNGLNNDGLSDLPPDRHRHQLKLA